MHAFKCENGQASGLIEELPDVLQIAKRKLLINTVETFRTISGFSAAKELPMTKQLIGIFNIQWDPQSQESSRTINFV